MSEETTNPEESLETPITEATEVVATEETPVAEETTEETVAETTEEKPVKEAPAPKEPETPHDEFDWSISNRNQYIYTAAERERLEAAYDKTLGAVNENEVIKAKVHQITGGDAVLLSLIHI